MCSTKFKMYTFFFAMLFCLLIITPAAKSQVIKGKVVDASTGEPLVGATVKLDGTNKYTTLVKLDGSYSFTKITAGTYSIIISYAGYKKNTEETSVTVASNQIKIVSVTLEPNATAMESVTITANAKSGDKGARQLEKIADPLLNVLSSKTIQLLPDITVANALQRVSGVTIEKSSSGEGRYPIIRGMEKRYINTLVNGIKIPSPDNKNRFIPLDLFPSELLERLEVSKSLTPSMEGDAIGGTINLVMKDAPENKLLNVNFSAGYNNIFGSQNFQSFNKSSINKQSPNQLNGATYAAKETEFSVAHLNYTKKTAPINTTFGLSVGNRFGKDKKLGVLLSGSYQNQYRGTATVVFTPSTTPNVDDIPAIENLREREYALKSQRLGVTSKVDYKFNNRNKISLFNTYVKLSDFQVRNSIDTTNAINQTLSYSTRVVWQYQSIYNSTLQGLHKLTPTLNFDWSAVYSIAKNTVPDQTSFSHGGLSIDRTGPTVKLSGEDILSGMSRTWTSNSDKDLSIYLNLTKQTKIFKRALDIKIGGLYRNKNRDNFYNTYSLNPLRIGGANQLYTSVNNAQFTFIGSNPTAQLNGNNYTFTENVASGYVQGKWKLSSKLEALGGVRIENTNQKYNTQLPLTTDYVYGTISYTDVLPSIQFKYQLKKNQALRASYYKALARPQFSELIPDGPDNFELFKQLGNPQGLEHSKADNFDLRYEYFPGGSNQILLGVFYKRLQNPIELSITKLGYNAQAFRPVNIGTAATNYGFEAVYTKYFGVFGVSANYTYTQSKITNDSMLFKYKDPTIGITDKYIPETRPLQGQSNHIGNLSLLYKNPKIGFDAQVAFVYTGERLAILNTYWGLHYWQQPTTQLDFSFEKRIKKQFSFYGKINNLTNTPTVTAIHQSYNAYLQKTKVPLNMQSDPDNKIIVQKDFFKTSFLFGFRYKL
jgi:outer membrane receptor protein involved in Fe transport